MIDRITGSLLKDFDSKFDFATEKIEDNELFEHFVNYTVLEKKLEDRIDGEKLEKIHIGKNGTFGLDGFCILVNKHLITSKEDLNEIISNNTKPIAEIFFIQAKTSNSFEVKEISSFGNAIEDFVAIDQRYKWSEVALAAIEVFKELTNRASELDSNPNCHIYYASLGTYKSDTNTQAQKEKILESITNQRVFNKIEFSYFDYNTLQNDYKKIGQKITRTFNFSKRTLIPDIEGVEEAYIGVVPVTTIVDLIEEDNELITSIFYDNVRDFQGFNKINEEIKLSISDDKLKYAFSVLNNGITIVAEKLSQSRENVTVTNYQIINGLQTSRVLQHSKEFINNNIFVTLKLIITQDENLISKIIRSTNRQTEVKEEDLIAYSDFQKRLEDYFKTFNEPEKLFYERRSKQYNNSNVDFKLIIDKSTLIKVMGSFYFMKPNLATRYFGALFSEFGRELFKEDHKLLPYYTAAIIYIKLENLFRTGAIDKKYKKIRFFILMMIRLEYNKKGYPPFESNKVEKFCNELLEYIKVDRHFTSLIQNALQKLATLSIDFSSTEISKSAKLVDSCKEKYFTDR
jgi:hypothetical protein